MTSSLRTFVTRRNRTVYYATSPSSPFRDVSPTIGAYILPRATPTVRPSSLSAIPIPTTPSTTPLHTRLTHLNYEWPSKTEHPDFYPTVSPRRVHCVVFVFVSDMKLSCKRLSGYTHRQSMPRPYIGQRITSLPPQLVQSSQSLIHTT